MINFLSNIIVRRIINVHWYASKHKQWMFYLCIYFCSVFLYPLSAYCHNYHKIKFVITIFIWMFFAPGIFAAPVWVSACTLLMCDEAGSVQSELLSIMNFQGLSVGTAGGPFDWIFPVREDLRIQKVHKSPLLTRTCTVCSDIQHRNMRSECILLKDRN